MPFDTLYFRVTLSERPTKRKQNDSQKNRLDFYYCSKQDTRPLVFFFIENWKKCLFVLKQITETIKQSAALKWRESTCCNLPRSSVYLSA